MFLSMCPQYLWKDTPHAYGRTTLKFRFLMGIFKFSDPPYGGSNEVFGKNQNFPLVLNIKLHLKMSVNYQLQISPPLNCESLSQPSWLDYPIRAIVHPVTCEIFLLHRGSEVAPSAEILICPLPAFFRTTKN